MPSSVVDVFHFIVIRREAQISFGFLAVVGIVKMLGEPLMTFSLSLIPCKATDYLCNRIFARLATYPYHNRLCSLVDGPRQTDLLITFGNVSLVNVGSIDTEGGKSLLDSIDTKGR